MKTTFWNLLNSKGIVIPIIQRDYAQGRSGEKYQHIRENFLKQIGKVIDVLPMDEGEEASNSMDFIYGMEDMNPINGKNSIYPIDGQQRLTALWLIHWYVAFKAKKTDLSQFTEAEKKRINDPSDKLDDLSPEKKEIVETIKKLKKFSYETRTSSREFCQNLCDLKGAEKQSETGIVQFIKNQTWFLSVWEQDPTIKAMLNMLEGEKDGMKDGIEKLFAKCDDYIGCWDRLTCNKCSVCNCDKCTKTISFHYLPMNLAGKNSESDIRPNSEEHVSEDSLQLSDDLYIKMNARGKALTSFENFKAHYISWLQKEKSEDWIKIASKIDIEWTNIFWQIKGDKENVDKLYFTFINRYLWTHTFILTDYEGKYIIREQYKRFSDATSDEYNDFTLYAKLFKTNSLTNSLEKTLDNISKYYTTNKNNEIKELFPAWVQQKKSFLLEYDDSEYSEKQLIVFFGICKYFENQRFEKESFTDWIRVVWNLVENWTTQEACIRLLNVLSKHSDSILNYLHRIINIEDCEELKIYKDNKQLQEEIVKANQMIHGKIEDLPSIPEDWDHSKEWNWETAIIEAEKYAFFKGAIRFLFTDAEGNMNDWGNFAVKWDRAQSYYDEKGLNKEWQDARLLKGMISLQTNFWKTMWWWYTIFNNTKENWHSLLLNKQWQGPVHHILMGEVNAINNSDNNIAPLLEKDFLEHIIEKQPKAWIRNYGSFHALWTSGKPRDRIVLNDILHNMASGETPKISYLKPIGDSGYATGEGGCIDFIYCNHLFRWQNIDWVDMYEGDKKLFDTENGKTLHTEFNGQGEHSFHDAESLEGELKRCVDTYEKLKQNNLI